MRDRAALTGALSILPEYLRNAATESGEVVDYRDWHPQLGRRFRAIKLWAVLRTYGLEGLRAHVRSGVALAEHVADLVAADDRFEMVTEPSLSPGGLPPHALATSRRWRRWRPSTPRARPTSRHTTVEGRAAIRLAVGSWRTTEADVDRTWRALQRAASAQG